MQSTAADDTFENIDDATTRIILGLSLVNIDQMLLDEQKKRGGEVSEWEQALVTHRGELRRGLAALKESTISHGVTHSITIDEDTTVVVHEREAQNDQARACRLRGLPDISQQAILVDPTPPQTPPPSSQDATMIQTSNFSQNMTNDIQATVPRAASSSANRLLENAAEVEQSDSKRVETGSQRDVDSYGRLKSVETLTSSISYEIDIANTVSEAQPSAQNMANWTSRNLSVAIKTPKRSSDEAGFEEQSNAKRVDTGKRKGKQFSGEDRMDISTPLRKRRATLKRRWKVGTRRMR